MNEVLSICIPTYNRSGYLKNGLEKILPYIEKYEIPIYISDNASEDDTIDVVLFFKSKYKYIFFEKNIKNIGPDKNFEKVLKMSKTKYSWLLSDDDQINGDCMRKILNILDGDIDYVMVVVNGKGRVKGIKEKIYEDRNELLSEIGWHMNYMSCLIFSDEVIKKSNWNKYYGTYLVQFAVIFDFLSRRDAFKIYWIDQAVISANKSVLYKNNTGWSYMTFDIFSHNWCKIINELPDSYLKTAKTKCIKFHGEKSGLFTIKNILFLRYRNIFNYRVLKMHKKSIGESIKYPYVFLLFVSIIPSRSFYCLEFIKILYHKFLNK